MKKTLVLLTRNEIDGLKAMIPKIPFADADEVLAIDYKSTDGSKELLALQKGIQVIHQEKSGRGEAMRMASAQAKGAYLCFFSPDGNEDPADIQKLFSKIEEGYDLVVASRFIKGSRNEEDDQFFKWRSWANQMFTFLANLFFGGRRMTDTINGYRVIRKTSFDRMRLDAEGYAIEYQMSIRAKKAKMKIAEIPTYEGNRIGGASKAKSIPVGFKVFKLLLKEIISGKKFLNNANA